MTSQHERLSSSRDYQMEAEHTRRRLAEHLDELSDRLTPGQVFDEMLTYTRAGRGTFFRAFSNAMRENPVPSLLIGAGCMMFLSEKMGLRPGGGGDGGARRAMRTSDEGYDPYRPNTTAPEQPGRTADASARVDDAAGRMGDATGRMSEAATSTARSAAASVQAGARRTADVVGHQAGGAASAVKQAVAAVGDTMAGAADSVRSSTYGLRDQATGAVDQIRRGAAGAMRDASSSLTGRISDTAERTRRGAAEAVRQSRDSATSFITEQPILCAAIGVAVGAAIASMLPSTETEDEWMGEASDSVKGSASQVVSQVASEGLDSAKNVAGKVVERAQGAMKEEGLTPSAFTDAARNLGEGTQKGASTDPTSGAGPQEGTRSDRS